MVFVFGSVPQKLSHELNFGYFVRGPRVAYSVQCVTTAWMIGIRA
jgi:hypothetical protein